MGNDPCSLYHTDLTSLHLRNWEICFTQTDSLTIQFHELTLQTVGKENISVVCWNWQQFLIRLKVEWLAQKFHHANIFDLTFKNKDDFNRIPNHILCHHDSKYVGLSNRKSAHQNRYRQAQTLKEKNEYPFQGEPIIYSSIPIMQCKMKPQILQTNAMPKVCVWGGMLEFELWLLVSNRMTLVIPLTTCTDCASSFGQSKLAIPCYNNASHSNQT